MRDRGSGECRHRRRHGQPAENADRDDQPAGAVLLEYGLLRLEMDGDDDLVGGFE
ncbi:hypothetical protein [Nonomuraea solani]|uniref:hypothetical protein n=1 Tax=Nonomuraea solani TaxID=1144553 RepID=UPI00135AE2E0|nr:hypothetical protein [Nonomuraea solani]